MFGRLGRFVVQNPWKVIGAWIVAAVALVLLGPSLSSVTNDNQSSFLPHKYESVQANDALDKAFPSATGQTATIVVRPVADGGTLSAADQQKISDLATTVTNDKLTGIAGVQAGQVSPKQNVQLMFAKLTADQGDQKAGSDAIKALRTDLGSKLNGTGLKAEVTGDAAMGLDTQDSSQKATGIVMLATLGLIIILMGFIFRGVIAIVLPIVSVFLVMMVSQPVIALMSKAFGLHVQSFLEIMLVVVLFGIGTDYIVFLLFRLRERLRAGDTIQEAVVTTVERVGEAIASAAAAVIIAFCALALATFKAFTSLGPALAIAVFVMLLAGLTLVPALMVKLGTRIFWPGKKWRRIPSAGPARRAGNLVGSKPLAVTLVSFVIMAGLAVGAVGFKADYDQQSQMPANVESTKAVKDMQNGGFPQGASAATEVVVTSADGKPLDQAAMLKYADRLGAASPEIGGVMPFPAKPGAPADAPKEIVAYNADGTAAHIQVLTKDSPFASKAMAAVNGPLKDLAHSAAPAGSKALVGGPTAALSDIQAANSRDLSVILPVAAALIFLVLALQLRALVAPLYLMVAVGLGYAGTLGASVLLFQNLQGKPGMMFMLPVMVYLFVVAIGTDYNILMISRLREEAREGNSPRQAAALAVEHAGPSVASAGLILAGTFASLMLGGLAMMQQIGFAVSVGISIAAFLMSMFLVPAFTALIGDRAWWPGHKMVAVNRGGGEPPAGRHDEDMVGAGAQR
ncbi:MMPL family transporter [Catenulispora yoronensis]|uniref:MMPL family transporter n=1 Tax=Catenulispora yoronensis TaxID=450799 RepID=A0ABP5G455_9ACTN